VGQETNKPFPWVVSDFGLTDAIESGLVKIPQLALQDPSGQERAAYFNLWKWILDKLTPREKGGTKGSPKPEAVLKYAHHPIAMLGGQWEETRQVWKGNEDDDRPPVFIIVCKNTKIAEVIYQWLANGEAPEGIPTSGIEALRNTDGRENTVRIDSKVVHETDSDHAKSDLDAWMRLTLDTVGKEQWPTDSQGRPIYPEGFEELTNKLGKPLHPPGRDVRCIVSVGMLTEGWDCNTVTHIVGLRPFMSQLLCEQVVGRGLRRTSYEVAENGKLTEEVAQILGVPFEVVPYKAAPEGQPAQVKERKHVHALPEKARYEITFPRVDGYTQAIRNRVTVDWGGLPRLKLDPAKIPPEVRMKATVPSNEGRPSLFGPGRVDDITLNPYRRTHRMQEVAFELAAAITQELAENPECNIPTHVLFPQLLAIVPRYFAEKLKPQAPAEKIDVTLSPYYGWAVERIRDAIHGDPEAGAPPEVPRYEQHRGPGSTADVDYWTTRDVWPPKRSHLNYVVPDTKTWEQSAAYYIDSHEEVVDAFVKNAGLGFAIPYVHNGEPHDYVPDFIIRLKSDGEPERHLIVETKGFDQLEEVKRAAAKRWVNAVNADGQYGKWDYRVARHPSDVHAVLEDATGSRR
jgi:type III restriction enzyme